MGFAIVEMSVAVHQGSASALPHVVSLWPEAGAITPEIRVAVEVVVIVWLLMRGLPMAVRGVSQLVSWFAEPVASLLLLPEYALTTALRDIGRAPIPGTYGFGAGLGQSVEQLRSLSVELTNGLAKSRRIPWRLVLLVALLPLALSLLRVPLSGTESTTSLVHTIDQVQASWRPLDGVVMTGKREPYGELLLAAKRSAGCGQQP